MFTGVAKVQGSNPCKPENSQAFFFHGGISYLFNCEDLL